MLPITSSWKQYFRNHHEGLGTTYERFILNKYFQVLKDKFLIESVLEVPSFGMTGISGINSMWWAANGAKVTLIDDNQERVGFIKNVWESVPLEAKIIFQDNRIKELPFKDKVFDLGWNFAGLWSIPDLEEFLKELARVSKKVIFVCIPNMANVFNLFRLTNNKGSGPVYIENIDLSRIQEIMRRINWDVIEEGYLDCPPWPDIAMKKEDLLKKMGLSVLLKPMREKNNNSLCILDYFKGNNKYMENEILKHDWLENMPVFLKRNWAHHQYSIFNPRGKRE